MASINGSVTLLDNAQLSFTPNDGFSGTETFSYPAIEGTENFSIKIADAGDADITMGQLNVNINDKTHYSYVSPITLDLGGDGIQTLSLDAGVEFDILNTGEKVSTGWISGEDGFLAVDANGNGSIDDRSERFGGNVGEGFGKLASYDSNGDGWVNVADASFGELSIWQDANVNGITDSGELTSLGAAGIEALQVDYTREFSFDRPCPASCWGKCPIPLSLNAWERTSKALSQAWERAKIKSNFLCGSVSPQQQIKRVKWIPQGLPNKSSRSR